MARPVFWKGYSSCQGGSGQDRNRLEIGRAERSLVINRRELTVEVRWQETGDVRAVYRKWINIYFLKKFFLWKYNKCKMCDYSDIPIAYVLREGVIVILWWALVKAHINIFGNAEHTGNLRKPSPPADLSSQHSSPGKGVQDPSRLQLWWKTRAQNRKADG